MQSLIERADNQAKDYMRSYLYRDRYIAPERRNTFWQADYFMIGGDMEPINDHFRTVNWPNYTYVTKLSQAPEGEMKEKWREIFNDFGIIPV